MKVSDYIIQFLKDKGIDTAFCITGGLSAHLMESLRTSGIRVYHNYNEQACAMAAEGYARIAKKPALVLVTNGPGSSNTITGVLGAWQDSIPMFILSGQAPCNQNLKSETRPLRQLGLQEADIISMVQHCTNYAKQITTKTEVRYELEKAWHFCTTGRMGPVWIETPIDIQAQTVQINELTTYKIDNTETTDSLDVNLLTEIENAKKPLLVIGNGIHLANVETPLLELVDKLQIPVVATWNAKDLFDYSDPLYVGNFGLLGERAANFAVQESDLLIILGSRLSIPCTGYATKDFSPHSKKIMVDLDINEMSKHTLQIDYKCVGELKDYIDFFKQANSSPRLQWLETVQKWKTRFDLNLEDHSREPGYVNSFDFMQRLSKALQPNDVVVTDMGTSFTCTMQALRHTGEDRLFTSSALCSMGYGLPGAIGAYIANPKNRVICMVGDGGIQMNIQELQTIAHHRLPIKIVLLNNSGMLAISLMQDNLFDQNYFGCNEQSGVSNPDFQKLATAYGINSHYLETQDAVDQKLSNLLLEPGPALIEINMVRNQLLIPRVQSRKDEKGQIASSSIDVMFPYLEQEQISKVQQESNFCN